MKEGKREKTNTLAIIVIYDSVVAKVDRAVGSFETMAATRRTVKGERI